MKDDALKAFQDALPPNTTALVFTHIEGEMVRMIPMQKWEPQYHGVANNVGAFILGVQQLYLTKIQEVKRLGMERSKVLQTQEQLNQLSEEEREKVIDISSRARKTLEDYIVDA